MKNRVFVVGGGASLKGFDFDRLANEDTIAVNKAMFSLPATYFITMDYTFLRKVNIQEFRKSKASKVFIANLEPTYMEEAEGKIVDTRFSLVYALNDFDLVVKSRQSGGIGTTFRDFRSGKNSGFCGLQLAVLLRYEEIYLLGMDLNAPGATHYHGGYGEAKERFKTKLEAYFECFSTALQTLLVLRPDIRVISCSPMSRLNGIIGYSKIDEVLSNESSNS